MAKANPVGAQPEEQKQSPEAQPPEVKPTAKPKAGPKTIDLGNGTKRTDY